VKPELRDAERVPKDLGKRKKAAKLTPISTVTGQQNIYPLAFDETKVNV
jgi:hypothetical protein